MQVYGLTSTNNSLIGSSEAHLYATGTGCGNQGVSTICPGSTLPNETMVNYSGSQNYLSSPSNQYNSDAYTITPSVSGNYCAGSSGGSWCTTTGFTQNPTASFILGNLYEVGSTYYVPFATEGFTAQYGAVKWLASTSSTTPTPSGQAGTSNTWSYLPPVTLAATHGNTVYMWTMDSANHISAAALQMVP
jgi:hypothetical protein